MIWAVLVGWFVFDQLPQSAVMAGALTVSAAGVFVLWRERQLQLVRVRDAEIASQRPT